MYGVTTLLTCASSFYPPNSSAGWKVVSFYSCGKDSNPGLKPLFMVSPLSARPPPRASPH